MTFWFDQLVCSYKFSQIKAKNTGIAVAMSRLFNVDMWKFNSKMTDKLNRLWYKYLKKKKRKRSGN